MTHSDTGQQKTVVAVLLALGLAAGAAAQQAAPLHPERQRPDVQTPAAGWGMSEEHPSRPAPPKAPRAVSNRTAVHPGSTPPRIRLVWEPRRDRIVLDWSQTDAGAGETPVHR